MTPNDAESRWLARLTEAARTTRGRNGQAALARAAVALQLAWATECAVRAASADRELWCLRLAEAIAETADELELVPGAPLVPLGVGAAPDTVLRDSPAVRQALVGLLAAVRDALTGYSRHAYSGREKLAATLVAAAAARAVSAGGP
jgi:hypothetical protein